MWVVFFFCSGCYSEISLEDEGYSERKIVLLELIQTIIINSINWNNLQNQKSVARLKQNTGVSARIKGTLSICHYWYSHFSSLLPTVTRSYRTIHSWQVPHWSSKGKVKKTIWNSNVGQHNPVHHSAVRDRRAAASLGCSSGGAALGCPGAFGTSRSTQGVPNPLGCPAAPGMSQILWDVPQPPGCPAALGMSRSPSFPPCLPFPHSPALGSSSGGAAGFSSAAAPPLGSGPPPGLPPLPPGPAGSGAAGAAAVGSAPGPGVLGSAPGDAQEGAAAAGLRLEGLGPEVLCFVTPPAAGVPLLLSSSAGACSVPKLFGTGVSSPCPSVSPSTAYCSSPFSREPVTFLHALVSRSWPILSTFPFPLLDETGLRLFPEPGLLVSREETTGPGWAAGTGHCSADPAPWEGSSGFKSLACWAGSCEGALEGALEGAGAEEGSGTGDAKGFRTSDLLVGILDTGLLDEVLGGVGPEENLIFCGICKGPTTATDWGIRLELDVMGAAGIVLDWEPFITWMMEDEFINTGVMNCGRALDWAADCPSDTITLLPTLGMVTTVDTNADCKWDGSGADVLAADVIGLEVTKTVIWLGGKGLEIEELTGLCMAGGAVCATLALTSPSSWCPGFGQGSLFWGRLSELDGSLLKDESCSGGMTAIFFSSSPVGTIGAISRPVRPGGLMVTLGAPELSRSWLREVGASLMAGDTMALLSSMTGSLLLSKACPSFFACSSGTSTFISGVGAPFNSILGWSLLPGAPCALWLSVSWGTLRLSLLSSGMPVTAGTETVGFWVLSMELFWKLVVTGVAKEEGLAIIFLCSSMFCKRDGFCWVVNDNLAAFEFCLPGLGVVFLLDPGLDLRLLLGLALFVPPALVCLPELMTTPSNLCDCEAVKLDWLLIVRFDGACPMAFKVVGFRPCWSNPLLRLGLGGKGILIWGGKRPAIEALSLSGDRLISEGSVLGGRLLGVWG